LTIGVIITDEKVASCKKMSNLRTKNRPY